MFLNKDSKLSHTHCISLALLLFFFVWIIPFFIDLPALRDGLNVNVTLQGCESSFLNGTLFQFQKIPSQLSIVKSRA